jgi:hypothetical protein
MFILNWRQDYTVKFILTLGVSWPGGGTLYALDDLLGTQAVHVSLSTVKGRYFRTYIYIYKFLTICRHYVGLLIYQKV